MPLESFCAATLVGPSALPRRVERGHQSVGCLPATVDTRCTLDEPPLVVGRLDQAHGVLRRRGRLIAPFESLEDHELLRVSLVLKLERKLLVDVQRLFAPTVLRKRDVRR